ncbi:HIT domain-containing protein [bacterium]|nr:HIT domain-containing protein [bacterium]
MKRLWAPWRIGYILGDKAPNGCVFCRKGASKDDRADLVLERGAHAYVLLNTFPYNPGHLMVAPYVHVALPAELPVETQHELWDLTVKWQCRLVSVMKAGGVNVGINLGAVAGAGIIDHMHVHLVPRWQGDTNFMSTAGDTRVMSQALEELYDKLKP